MLPKLINHSTVSEQASVTLASNTQKAQTQLRMRLELTLARLTPATGVCHMAELKT